MINKKMTKIIALLLIATAIPTDKCYAGIGIDVGIDFGESGKQEYDKDGNLQNTISNWKTEGNKTYTCQYSYKFNYSQSTDIDVFNKKGESIIYEKNNEIKFSEEILAGTSVGMQIVETKTVSWDLIKATVTGVETIQKNECTGGYKCFRTYTPTFCPTTAATIFGFKIPFLKIDTKCPQKTEECTCGSSGCGIPKCQGYTEVTDTREIIKIDDKLITECENKGKKDLLDRAKSLMYPSYEVRLRNPNDADAKTSVGNTSVNSCGFPDNAKSKTCYYNYKIETTCMNVKTGEVRYNARNNTCGKDEINITPKDNKWQYFVPLDTKNNDTFGISLVEKADDEIKPVKFCEQVINAKSNYWDYIKDTNLNRYSKDKKETLKTISKQKGCRLDTEIEFDIEQKFYNEQSDGTFKGFNFYYKPIDVNNPFPNGLPSNSIWTNEKINILKGTNNENITYIANVTNAKAIRDYKNKETNYKKNLYTSWENMHLNGVSDFIENGGFVKRYVQKTDFYKLGCGPANEKKKNSDGTTNYLYQQECGT